MESNSVRLFLGDPIGDPAEKALVSRLLGDLERLGVRATLCANFFPPSRRSRQVDLLVCTECRTAHVEIKGLRPDWPVRARLNGPWAQLLPNGTIRSLEKNAARQALEGTYAISDAMRGLAQSRAVTAPGVDFKRHIDTIVGMWENIPAGSKIKTPPYVKVLGYGDLLGRLTTPGPRVSWTDDEWDTFVRELGLFQPKPESAPERRRRSSLEGIEDYRLQAQRRFADGSDAFVDVGVAGADGVGVFAADISCRLADGGALAVVGPSGCGKTFLARDLAVRHCGDGRLVVWTRAGAYEKARFGDLLARAMAPFSVHRWETLVEVAKEFGVPITVILDGLNECPADVRGELLEELEAFRLRYPASVLVTSTGTGDLPATLDAAVLRVREPDESARLKILVAYGAKRPERIGEQFRTPYELAIAAECEGELGEHASVTELHAAYIRKFAPTVQLRAGLRSLASCLHEQLRTSLPLLEATSILNAPDLDLEPRKIDEVLVCHLLVIDGHRVRFRHELLGQFFAAEDLVRSATSGQHLGWLLDAPANRVLTETALGLEGDHNRVWEALKELANSNLVSSAVAGRFGSDVAELASREIRNVLRRSASVTAAATAMIHSGVGFFGRWVAEHEWTEWEGALFASAGQGLTKRLFVDEVCELIDRTDEVCLDGARRLKGEGDQAPVSQVVGATYVQSATQIDGSGLAASYVVAAFERAVGRTRYTPDWHSGLASRFAAGAGAHSWGRLYLALLAVDSEDPSDQALFASLLRRAWDAGGYHLRLQALQAAEFFGSSGEPYHSEILDVLRTLSTDHWSLHGALVQALARFGEIESPTTEEELRAHIRAVISHPEDSDYFGVASGIVSSQFEDETIFGPYFAAIDGLSRPEKMRLFTMAARDSDPTASMSLDWTLERLAELVPSGDTALDDAARSVFAAFLDGPPEDAAIPQQAVNAYLAAIRGWAKFEPALPPTRADPTSRQRNWRLTANLLLSYERHDAAVDEEATWRTLLHEPRETIMTLASIEHAALISEYRPLWRLIEDYPEPLRRLFESALENLADVPAYPLHSQVNTAEFVMRMLGAVGDESTAARLRAYELDPETGGVAVDAIRQIHRRIAP